MILFNTDMWTKQIQGLSLIQNDMFYKSCLAISMFSLLCTSSMRDILTMGIWALIYQELRICSVTPSILSEHAISRYDTLASYYGIVKIKVLNEMRWNIHKLHAPKHVHDIDRQSFPVVPWRSSRLETQCWMSCYELMLMNPNSLFFLHFDCENSMADARAVA